MIGLVLSGQIFVWSCSPANQHQAITPAIPTAILASHNPIITPTSLAPTATSGSQMTEPITTPLKLPTVAIGDSSGKPVLKTALGDLVISSYQFVDEVNGVTPNAGENILLLILTKPGVERLDPGTFSLEAFDKMVHDPAASGEIYIQGDDESKTISTMAGWVDNEFAMGFRLPTTTNAYKLFWPGNPSIDIIPEN